MQDQDRVLEFNEQVLAEAKELGLLDDPKEEVEKIPSGNKEEEIASKVEKSTEREYTEVEKEQMALGWDPKHPGGVDAAEFKRVGEIIEAKRAASKRAELANKEVQELTKTVKNLVEHNRKLEKASYDKALKDLQTERNNRISEGDIDAVNDLNLREKVLEKAKETVDRELPVVEEEVPTTPAVEAYKERNRFWLYGDSPEDKKMQILTDQCVEYLRKAEPTISEQGAIDYVEAAVRNQFPDRFDNPAKEKASAVMKSTSSPKGKAVDVSDLSSEQRASFYAIQKVDPTFTMKEYTEQLETIGRR